MQQTRFKMLLKSNPEHAKLLWQEAQEDAETRYRRYEYLAQRKPEPVVASTTPVETEK
jgi:pyruvate-ferredoxin/flavodoxin oxidoreductase